MPARLLLKEFAVSKVYARDFLSIAAGTWENVETQVNPHQAAEIMQPFFEAGATWCIELSPEIPEQYLECIRTGPPIR
jgi:hypothetical protein